MKSFENPIEGLMNYEINSMKLTEYELCHLHHVRLERYKSNQYIEKCSQKLINYGKNIKKRIRKK